MHTRYSSALALLLLLVPAPVLAGSSLAFEQHLPMLRALATVDDAGLTVETGQDRLELRTASWGRDGEQMAQDLARPSETGCAPGRYRVQVVSCPITVERPLFGGVERWTLADRLEQSWTLEHRPASVGPVVLDVAVLGADLKLNEDHITLTTGSGVEWTYGELFAWDAQGRPLEAWLDVEADHIRVYVDDTDARWPIEIDPVLTTASQSLTQPSTDFGIAVSFGDVNNDSKSDLLVGARFGVNLYGQTFSFHGGTSSLNTTPTTTMTGGFSYGKFGETVSIKGDVNGDGYDDALITEYYEDRLHVFHGSSSGFSTSPTLTLSGEYGFGRHLDIAGRLNNDAYDDIVVSSFDPYVTFFKGSATGINTTYMHRVTLSEASVEVSGVGDTNGDGYDDVAYCSWASGSVTVIRGASTFPGTSTTLTVSGMTTLCSSLARAGDVNGDGYDDMIVGDTQYSNNTGVAVIFYGSSSGLSNDRVWQIPAPVTGSGFGFTVSEAGDVNGDGYDDVMVSDNYEYSYVYVFHGSSSGPVTSYVNRLNGESSSFGFALAGGADINHDGYDDVAIGDFGQQKVFLYYGCPDTDRDGYCTDLDCNDSNAAVKPTSQEICDSIDNDCDSQIDDADASTSVDSMTTWYPDQDDDGFGSTSETQAACSQPTGYLAVSGDCLDSNAAINPDAQEVCDGKDNDCDGTLDDDDDSLESSSQPTWYADRDGDGYGVSEDSQVSCGKPRGYVLEAGDCDDLEEAVNPAADEVCDDENVDEDCDTLSDDADDSTDPASMTTWFADADGDGYGDNGASKLACEGGDTDVTQGEDCNDESTAHHPGAEELCDGTDNNCDGLLLENEADASACDATPTDPPESSGGGCSCRQEDGPDSSGAPSILALGSLLLAGMRRRKRRG